MNFRSFETNRDEIFPEGIFYSLMFPVKNINWNCQRLIDQLIKFETAAELNENIIMKMAENIFREKILRSKF